MEVDRNVLQDETTAVNALLLAVTGIIFAITIGSFFGYHVYLVT